MALFDKISEVLKTDLNKEITFRRKVEEPVFESTFVQKLQQRRSIYDLGRKVHYSQGYLAQLIFEAVRACPSAYNSQSTRIVVLFGDSHLKFWQIAQDIQRQLMPAHVFEGELVKIKQCSAALGTILFFEDQKVIKDLQKQKPLYANEFQAWAEQTSGMAQFSAWVALSEAGLGASLQHYNPIVDHAVAEYFSIEKHWIMRSQLVFGSIEKDADEKQDPLIDEERFKIYA